MSLPLDSDNRTASRLTIRSGNASVIANGTVIAFDLAASVEIEFTIRDDPLSLILEHTIDPSDPRSRWEIKGENENPRRARVRIINLQATPIGALPTPARLWTGPEGSIFLHLRYLSFPGSPPLFHYTIFLKPNPAKGA
jgi:hypothetical protein